MCRTICNHFGPRNQHAAYSRRSLCSERITRGKCVLAIALIFDGFAYISKTQKKPRGSYEQSFTSKTETPSEPDRPADKSKTVLVGSATADKEQASGLHKRIVHEQSRGILQTSLPAGHRFLPLICAAGSGPPLNRRHGSQACFQR